MQAVQEILRHIVSICGMLERSRVKYQKGATRQGTPLTTHDGELDCTNTDGSLAVWCESLKEGAGQ